MKLLCGEIHCTFNKEYAVEDLAWQTVNDDNF